MAKARLPEAPKPDSAPNPYGVRGDGKAVRSELVTFSTALARGYAMSDAERKKGIELTCAVLNDPKASKRAVARAMQTMLQIDRLVLDASVAGDRANRLDEGDVTTRIGIASDLSDEQLAAVAKAVRAE